ncbi:DUF2062 domain-containing protein [Sphingomonas gilva]|uniref:DUF2062 domain-containing protein n=1 Tax=Sphingomonas gilva TaxID=2305907 RepID=A0A396RSI8_9SPHN|nr:DUF2062 domain-containing protein [Sphingomonas gilva]RHW16551.1 DUF2062 domain-containing protein [Sphingomonas gilva]
MFQKSVAWVRRNTPTREQFEGNRWLRPVAHRVLRPELWRFHRRSVPRGVALGWIVGVLIPVAQTIFAALLALPARANVPVAALTTFLTNPFTTPPIWYAAYRIGDWALHLDAQIDARPVQDTLDSSIGDLLKWLVSDAAPATALGLLIIAVVGAAIGYLIAAFGWRWWIAHKWRNHRRRH